MRIDCPHCGLRPVEEFTMKGDASLVRPAPVDPATMDKAQQAQWHDYVFLRDNPKGRFAEYWHHAGGCRAWLVVERNTITHEVYSVTTAIKHARAKNRAAAKPARRGAKS